MKHCLTILLLFTSICIFNQSAFAQPSLFNKEVYRSAAGDSLLYRFLYPDNDPTRRYPLVVFLHGSGERGTDNEAQLKWGVQNFASDRNLKLHTAFVLAPQCPPNANWASTINDKNGIMLLPTPTRTMQLVMEAIHDVIKKFPVDTTRIYITGLSMGGYGTFDLLERYPNFFAAAVPVCGGGDISRVASIAHIPMWVFTGADDPSVNPANSYAMVNALVKAGARPGFTVYPGVGHFSWVEAYADEMMMEWLFSQRKGASR